MPGIVLRDGGHLHYIDEGQGPAVLMLHGWGMRGEIFRAQIDALSPRCRVVCPDLRGHGRSAPVGENQGMQTLQSDVAELTAQLDLRETCVIGWSMGAMLGWGLAAELPDRFSGLVSIDMVPRLLNNQSWQFGLHDREGADAMRSRLQRMRADWRQFSTVVVARLFADGALDRGDLQALAQRMASDNDGASMATIWASLVRQDYRDTLLRLQLPILLIYGRRSQLYSAQAFAWLHDQLENSALAEFADSGHAPMLEQTELFNQTILQFIQNPAGYVRSGTPEHTT